jgi:hypothetical protein
VITNRVRSNRIRLNRITALAAAVALGTALSGVGTAAADPVAHRDDPGRADHGGGRWGSRLCPPSAAAINFSDALDKRVVHGMEISGLSDIAYDRHTHSYVSSVDNNGTDPSRVWFYRNLSDPTPVGDPVVLKGRDGTPYTGQTADNEGLGVLPNGDFVVSSEVEPSIRVFSPDGLQTASLPVPARFAVAPEGESTANATFEGLTIGRGGRQIIVSMEGTLAGDTGDGTFRRILVYTRAHHGYRLARQVGYRVDPGMRIPEIQEYAPGKLLIMEASWSAEVGNRITLYAVDISRAADVTDVADLATTPRLVVSKRLVADVTSCPDLGATAKETQINPLMDNYEGMTTRRLGGGAYAVSLISDDNNSAVQTSRILNLVALLP